MVRRYRDGMTWWQYDKAVSAHHESGHATVAVLIDKPFKTVSIIFRKGDGSCSKGRMDYDSEFWEEGRFLKPEVKLLTAFAGARAQQRFAPNSHWRYSGITDWSGAEAWLKQRHAMEGEELHAFMTRVDAHAYQLVKEHWDDICRVAAALLVRKTMDENEVRRIMGLPPRVDFDDLWRNYNWPERTPPLGVTWDRDDGVGESLMVDITKSNSLADLAARIGAEHEAIRGLAAPRACVRASFRARMGHCCERRF